MSEYPTLVVDGDPWDWTGDDIFDPSRNTVRIDGDLPTVTERNASQVRNMHPGLTRPLRVGDKVTLAVSECEYDGDNLWCGAHDQPTNSADCLPIAFATATVAEIERATHPEHEVTDVPTFVIVTDVEALR